MRLYSFYVVIMAVIGHCAFAADQAMDPRVELVKKLYAEYPLGTSFQSQSISRLEVYLTEDLAKLVDADNRCAQESDAICALDFDVLSNSQDPEGMPVVGSADSSGVVTVVFRSSDTPVGSLRFSFKNTATGPKIDNISSDAVEPKWSLRTIFLKQR